VIRQTDNAWKFLAKLTKNVMMEFIVTVQRFVTPVPAIVRLEYRPIVMTG
jgi:hypothetical protein